MTQKENRPPKASLHSPWQTNTEACTHLSLLLDDNFTNFVLTCTSEDEICHILFWWERVFSKSAASTVRLWNYITWIGLKILDCLCHYFHNCPAGNIHFLKDRELNKKKHENKMLDKRKIFFSLLFVLINSFNSSYNFIFVSLRAALLPEWW